MTRVLRPAKAVILARGHGRRMREDVPDVKLSADQHRLASLGIKALMPLADGRTILEYSVGQLLDIGFTDIILVIGSEHEVIRSFCQQRDLPVTFAIQREAVGTADAVLAVRDHVEEDESFLVLNSDNLYPAGSLAMLREADPPALIAFTRQGLIARSNFGPDRIAKFALLEIDSDGFLLRIVEKPDVVPADSFVSMNVWLFSPKIFAACEAIGPSKRGEYELADAVQFAVDRLGERYFVVKSEEGVLDLSSRRDIWSVERMLEER